MLSKSDNPQYLFLKLGSDCLGQKSVDVGFLAWFCHGIEWIDRCKCGEPISRHGYHNAVMLSNFDNPRDQYLTLGSVCLGQKSVDVGFLAWFWHGTERIDRCDWETEYQVMLSNSHNPQYLFLTWVVFVWDRNQWM